MSNVDNSWNQFAIKEPVNSILHSFEWGELQKAEGRKIWRLVCDNQGWNALLVKHKLPLGRSYLYCPRGIIQPHSLQPHSLQPHSLQPHSLQPHSLQPHSLTVDFIRQVALIAKKEKAIFLRIDPLWEKDDCQEILQDCQKRISYPIKQTRNVQPKIVWQLDISKSEAELLVQMKSKTRYNIRLAQRKGVVVRQAQDKKDFEKFYKLLQETAKRQGFSLHAKGHYEAISQNLVSLPFLQKWQTNQVLTPRIKIFLAEYKNELLAAALISFFNNRAEYLHGGSSLAHRQLMAPHLLHWQAILEAKKQGCFIYDFGGINLDSQHKWSGLTRFKQSFSGEAVEYIGTYDVVFNKIWYNGYRILRRVKS